MLAADHDVGEAKILPIDAVHHRFLRAAVEHLDVQAEQNHAVGHGLLPRSPQRRVAIPFAQPALVDQGFVGVHPDVGLHVVALGLADERIQSRAGVVPLAEQRFQPVDEGVLVGTVQRVARLKRDDPVPALGREELADFARREDVLAELGMLGLRQDLNLAADEVRLVGVPLQHHVGAGMIGPLGEIDALNILRLVPLEDVADVEGGDDRAGRVRQSDPLARLQLRGEFLRDRQSQRNRPGILLAVVFDGGRVEDPVVRGGIHRAGEWAEAAVAKAVHGREIGVGDGHLGQLRGVGLEFLDFGRGDRATNRFAQAAVRQNQISHRFHPSKNIEGIFV